MPPGLSTSEPCAEVYPERLACRPVEGREANGECKLFLATFRKRQLSVATKMIYYHPLTATAVGQSALCTTRENDGGHGLDCNWQGEMP